MPCRYQELTYLNRLMFVTDRRHVRAEACRDQRLNVRSAVQPAQNDEATRSLSQDGSQIAGLRFLGRAPNNPEAAFLKALEDASESVQQLVPGKVRRIKNIHRTYYIHGR